MLLPAKISRKSSLLSPVSRQAADVQSVGQKFRRRDVSQGCALLTDNLGRTIRTHGHSAQIRESARMRRGAGDSDFKISGGDRNKI